MAQSIKVSQYVKDRIGRTKDDFEVQDFKAGGKGGANQNCTNSGVRIIDKLTGLRSECREERDQPQNKAKAFKRLVALLQAFYAVEELAQVEDLRVSQVVRTYKEKDDLVVDNRTGLKYSYKKILEGKLEKMVEDLRLDESCQ